MKHAPWWTLLLAAALVGGCGKHEATANPKAATNSEAGEQAAADSVPQAPTRGPGAQAPATAPVQIADSGNPSATLGQLSLELRKYVLRTRSAPKSFEEFLAKSQVQAPPAPAGKHYAIQGGAVVLVNR